jgi:hypothetical protein
MYGAYDPHSGRDSVTWEHLGGMETDSEGELPDLTGPVDRPELTGSGNAKACSPSGVALGEGVRGFKMELSSPSSTVKLTESKSGATVE